MRIKCPRCQKKAIIRSSREMSPTLSQLYCLCGDPACGHSFVMDLSFSHTLSPSAMDLPERARDELRGSTPVEVARLFSSLA